MNTVLHVEDNVGATPELYKRQPRWPGCVEIACILALAIYLKPAFRCSEGSLNKPSLMCHFSFESVSNTKSCHGRPL